MPVNASIVFAACLLLASAARADDAARPLPVIGDAVYKGIVGKALDAVPMDPNERVALQKTGAVVSGTLTGRSVAAWAGLANPVLLVAGVVWGLFSASNIKPAGAGPKRAAKIAAKPGAPRRAALIEPAPAASIEPAQVALAAARVGTSDE